MQSVFTKLDENPDTDDLQPVDSEAPSAIDGIDISDPSEPTMGPLSKSRIDGET